ncbi:MAG: FGGY-family carbohydrate kinase [Propionicimonas sp.]
MASPSLLVGIDIGTSGTKAVLTDRAGRVLRVATRSHRPSHPGPGLAEHDPEATWWEPTVSLLRELCREDAANVAGIAVSGLGPCALVTDAAGRSLRPAILYAIDTRNLAQIEQMRRALDTSDPRAARLTTQSVGPKLLWIRDVEPDLWQRARRVFTSHSYVAYRLSGAYQLDRVSASWWDPLVDDAGTRWIPAEQQRWFPTLEWPDLVEPSAVVGVLQPQAADTVGLPAGTAVHAGTIDYAAQVLGTGATEPGDTVVVFGSTLSVNLATTGAVSVPGLQNSPAPLPGQWYLGGVTASAGSLLNWVRQLAGDLEFGQLEQAATRVPAGSDGVLLLPYFAGERSPLDDPRLRGVISGLDLSHGVGHLYRAALEAIGYSLRHILDQLGDRRPASILATGGGTASALLMQVVADIAAVEIRVDTNPHAAAVGTAMLAGAVPTGVAGQARIFTPDPRRTKCYAELFQLYRELGDATTPISHQLSKLPVTN